MKVDKPVRVNTRISKRANDWLDRKSLETGISKSALINMCIENYRMQMEVTDMLPMLLNELEKHGIKINLE